MTQYPNPDVLSANVVEEMIRKALEITPSKSGPVKMEALGIFHDPPKPDLKLREEILSQLIRNCRVPAQDFIEVNLNSFVESKFHGGGDRRPVRGK